MSSTSFAGAIRIENRAVLMRMIVAFMIVIVVLVLRFGRAGLGVVFEGVGRTQRFAFQAARRADRNAARCEYKPLRIDGERPDCPKQPVIGTTHV